MIHIPRENMVHPNIKFLRLTCLWKEKKDKPQGNMLFKNILNMTESGYGNVPIGDILATCDLILLSWNLMWALKAGENYVQTRLFPQQPILNVSKSKENG